MKPASMRNKSQVYSVGNYLMTGKVLGKGHFARVEEATHRIIGKKVAIKIIDLTCIKEEYARRNLHREPRVMAKLRHPCIAALYETMMHGPRLYLVMEAAGGGDLCAHVLSARNARGARGLTESRARGLAAQLVSAVRHMHARGVVHRDLKMENIMLDTSKQFIKIVDFGLSNVWSVGGALRTPCGSLEYAAPELFVDGRKYGPEVDLWSIGVIVYGMVTGGLPFTEAEGGGTAAAAGGAASRSRSLLRAAIAKGFSRKQKAALANVTPECKVFIQHLLEPNVDLRMKIEEASRHRWVKRPGLRMRTHPLGTIETKTNKDIQRQISELCGQTIIDIVAQIKAEPFGPIAGIYNIKTHLHQMQAVPGADLLWSSNNQDPRPLTPPEYHAKYEAEHVGNDNNTKIFTPLNSLAFRSQPFAKKLTPPKIEATRERQLISQAIQASPQTNSVSRPIQKTDHLKIVRKLSVQSPRCSTRPVSGNYTLKSPVYAIYANGDCLNARLPSIDEHSTDVNKKRKDARPACMRPTSMDQPRLASCPARNGDVKRTEFYRRGGDGLPSWRATGVLNPPRILLQSNATTIKRASLGNIASPHSSTNSHCKSEKAISAGWFSTKNIAIKETPHLQRLRRAATLK